MGGESYFFGLLIVIVPLIWYVCDFVYNFYSMLLLYFLSLFELNYDLQKYNICSDYIFFILNTFSFQLCPWNRYIPAVIFMPGK